MAEAVGLALGVVALLVPAYQGYRRCAGHFCDVRHHTKIFKACQRDFCVQKELFENECKLLLSGVVGSEIAITMLQDMSHPQWMDKNLVDWCSNAFSSAMNDAMTITRERLDDIERLLLSGGKNLAQRLVRDKGIQSLFKSIQDSRKHSHLDELSTITEATYSIWVLSPDLLQFRIPVWRLAKRFTWPLTVKPDVMKALSGLSKANQDFRTLRKQKSELAQATQNEKIESTAQSVSSPAPEFSIVHELARRLYIRLSRTGSCSCHRVNLRLDMEHSRCAATSKSLNFRLVITPEPGKGKDVISKDPKCTCLLVESEHQLQQEEVACSITQSTPPSTSQTNTQASKRKTPPRSALSTPTDSTKRPKNRTVSFQVTTNNATTTTFHATIDMTNLSTPGPYTIQNLCHRLAAAQEAQDAQQLFLLGKLDPTQGERLYREPRTFPSSWQTSLAQLLKRNDRNTIFPRRQRHRIALLLALSILQYGFLSTTWFRERWRAQDIVFFLDPQDKQGITPPGSTNDVATSITSIEPHVTAFFDNGSSEQSLQRRQGLARNEQLFSLAVVLTEVAFGDALSNIEEPENIVATDKHDPIYEYLKLKSIVSTNRLKLEVGRKYNSVVEKCLYGDFGRGSGNASDLTNTQGTFYEEIVVKLEECLRLFDDD